MYGRTMVREPLICPGRSTDEAVFPPPDFNEFNTYEPVPQTAHEMFYPRKTTVYVTMPRRANIFCRRYEDAAAIVKVAFRPTGQFHHGECKIWKDSAEWHGTAEAENGELSFWVFKWYNTVQVRGVKGECAYIEAHLAEWTALQHIQGNHKETVVF